jgi:predicted  nucleic acid-binding Zn-ribbon protein
MGADQQQILEIDELTRAVAERIESLVLDLAKLDEFTDADAYHALEAQIRALNDQQHMLNKRRSELTAGYLNQD